GAFCTWEYIEIQWSPSRYFSVYNWYSSGDRRCCRCIYSSSNHARHLKNSNTCNDCNEFSHYFYFVYRCYIWKNYYWTNFIWTSSHYDDRESHRCPTRSENWTKDEHKNIRIDASHPYPNNRNKNMARNFIK